MFIGGYLATLRENGAISLRGISDARTLAEHFGYFYWRPSLGSRSRDLVSEDLVEDFQSQAAND